jgi:hypothetical protein
MYLLAAASEEGAISASVAIEMAVTSEIRLFIGPLSLEIL